MAQIARNLTDAVDGLFTGKRYLIHDRDPLYSREFLITLGAVGIESVKLPPRSPNLNAYAERFVRTIKESCLEQMIFFGEDALRNAIREFVTHYNYAHNASIGSLTVLLSLPLLPASAIYTLVTRTGEPGWPLYALMIAFGSVFYSFPVFVIYSIWNHRRARRHQRQ